MQEMYMLFRGVIRKRKIGRFDELIEYAVAKGD